MVGNWYLVAKIRSFGFLSTNWYNETPKRHSLLRGTSLDVIIIERAESFRLDVMPRNKLKIKKKNIVINSPEGAHRFAYFPVRHVGCPANTSRFAKFDVDIFENFTSTKGNQFWYFLSCLCCHYHVINSNAFSILAINI